MNSSNRAGDRLFIRQGEKHQTPVIRPGAGKKGLPLWHGFEQVGIFFCIVLTEPFERQLLDIIVRARDYLNQLLEIRLPGQETLYHLLIRNIIGELVIIGHTSSVFLKR